MKQLFALALALMSLSSFAQQTDISFSPGNNGQTFNTCNGFVIDSGGQGGTGYSDNEFFTITICPDTITTGDNSLYITTTFNLFDLDDTNLGTQQNPDMDYMAVYDGTSTAASTLGTYNTDELQNVSIAATTNNGSGCLTFVFYSNAQGSGQFTASATCTQPCVPPTASAFIVDAPAPDSIAVCVGEQITFDGSASVAGDGFAITEYSWNFIDGTIDNTSGAVVTHAFENTGYYDVQLTLTDNNTDNVCNNLNVVPLKVFVSNYPTYYQFPDDMTICTGEEVDLIGIMPGPDGFGQYDSTWTGFPGSNAVDDGCLPDTLLGISQSIPITYTEFDPSATIEDVDDIVDICLNMEHSFMGDLVIQLSCPDGTTINLQTQGGGGTQIGVPDQADNVDCVNQTGIGEGWTYCWDNNATETWTDWVNGAGGFGNTLPEGTYASVDPLSDLIGCPLQGTWQITVIDNWAADDGTIFEFGVTFDPSFYPDIIEFTNTIGEDADSSYWDLSDPWITDNTDDLNQITIQPDQVGTFEYNYYVVNNFGCDFDSTVTVEVIEGPEITAGPDMTVCEDPVTLQGAIVGGPVPTCGGDAGTYNYCYENNDQLVVTYCPDNPGDGITLMQMEFVQGQMDLWGDWITIYDGDSQFAPWLAGPNTDDMAGLVFTATENNATGCLTFVLNSDGVNSCDDGTFEEWIVNVSCVAADDGMVWEWTPATGLSDPNAQTPSSLVDQATEYTLTAYPVGFPGCAQTDQVLIAPDAEADPGLDTDSILCYNSPISFLIDYLEGTPAPGGVWTDENGDVVPNQFNPTAFPNGTTFTYTYTVGNGTCEGQSELNVTVLDALNANCCQTNAVAGDDAYPCALSYELQAESPVGQGTWTGPEGVTFSDIHDPNAIASMEAPGGVVTLTWTDDNGFLCSESDEVEVTFSEPVSLLVVPEDALCYNQASGTAIGVASGGTVTNGLYNYDWEEIGVAGIIPQTRDSIPAGTYQVKVWDNAGCIDSTTYTISEPNPQEIFITQAPPRCAEECSGRIGIRSAGAVDYSFDGGNTWVADSIFYTCAGDFDVIARNANGCEISQPVSLVDPLEFKADFNINPLPTTIKNTRITFQDISSPGPIHSSYFVFGEYPAIGEAHDRISIFEFPKDTAGIYPVTLFSTSVNGCTDTTTKNVIIHDDLIWYIPNSFTPNEDGINDVWRPVGNTLDIRDFEVTILDRWGGEVFHTKDYNQGWNGSSNKGDGEHYLPTGVYTYLIKVSSATTEDKREITGFITLIR